jgi:hypothetical protein
MTANPHHPHRVTRAVAGVRAELTGVADAPVWSMGAAETAAALTELDRAEAQVAELKARLLVHGDFVAVGQDIAMSTPNWLAHTTKTTRVATHRAMRLAKALEDRDLTRGALAEGRVNLEQAQAIIRAVDDLPDGLDPDLIGKAEAHLIDQAQDFDAKALKNLGRHLLEVIDPDAADAHTAKLLELEERAAAVATRLTMWDDGHGKTHGRFTVDTAVTGAALKKALLAFAAPKHQASRGPLGERRPTPERYGQAFAEMVQRYPAKKLPRAGGLNATVVVTMTLETLLGGLKAAKLDTGEELSPGAARRLACEAGIIPAVLGGKSQVLDLGRKKRFHTQAQRIVKTIEAGGCEVDGCHWPPGMSHLHHPTRWADGGGTNRDAIMICPPHHARAHDQRYDFKKLPTGKYGFNRRT